MGEASSEPDVDHYVDSRSELFQAVWTEHVFDIVSHSYRFHQANLLIT